MLGWLFGGSKAASATIDGIKTGLDKLYFSGQEKAQADSAALALWVEYQKATQPQNIARRVIAFQVSALWSLFVLLAGLGAVFDFGYTARLMEFIGQISAPFMLVMVFYFGKRMIRHE